MEERSVPYESGMHVSGRCVVDTAGNRSATVPITVSGHTGGPTTSNFNERINGGKWNTHGTYTFPSGAQGTVQVTDQNGQAAADAVRFVLVPSGYDTPEFKHLPQRIRADKHNYWVKPSSYLERERRHYTNRELVIESARARSLTFQLLVVRRRSRTQA